MRDVLIVHWKTEWIVALQRIAEAVTRKLSLPGSNWEEDSQGGVLLTSGDDEFLITVDYTINGATVVQYHYSIWRLEKEEEEVSGKRQRRRSAVGIGETGELLRG